MRPKTQKPLRMREYTKLPAPKRKYGVLDVPLGKNDGARWYINWTAMLHRVHNPKVHKRSPCYVGTTVAPEWLYASKFKEWHDANYRPGFELDKDLKFPGSKRYSPETCSYVPRYLNRLYTGSSATYPENKKGVSAITDQRGKVSGYTAHVGVGNKTRRYLGYYPTEEAARAAYILAKRERSIAVIDTAEACGDVSPELATILRKNAEMMWASPHCHVPSDEELEAVKATRA